MSLDRQLVDYRPNQIISPALSHWKAKLETVESSPVRVVFIGSSTTIGTGAPNHLRRYTNLLEKIWQRRYTTATRGGFGVIGINSFNQVWTTTGTVATVNKGLGVRSRSLAQGATMNRTFEPTTGFTIIYAEGNGAGSFTVQLDNGNDVVITPDSTGSERYTGVTTVYAGSTRGRHNLKIIADNACIINYVYAHDGDDTKGIHCFTSALAGVQASAFTNAELYQAIGAIDADLVQIMLGSNDYSANVNPDTYKTNVQGIIDNVNAATTASIALIHSFRRFDNANPTYAWSEYGLRMQQLAVQYDNVFFLDISGYFPADQGADTNNFLDPDDAHPTETGHAYIARLIADGTK